MKGLDSNNPNKKLPHVVRHTVISTPISASIRSGGYRQGDPGEIMAQTRQDDRHDYCRGKGQHHLPLPVPCVQCWHAPTGRAQGQRNQCPCQLYFTMGEQNSCLVKAKVHSLPQRHRVPSGFPSTLPRGCPHCFSLHIPLAQPRSSVPSFIGRQFRALPQQTGSLSLFKGISISSLSAKNFLGEIPPLDDSVLLEVVAFWKKLPRSGVFGSSVRNPHHHTARPVRADACLCWSATSTVHFATQTWKVQDDRRIVCCHCMATQRYQ